MYGRVESPIYPYIWWRRADDGQDLDADVETIVRTVPKRPDGPCGGWIQNTAPRPAPCPGTRTPLVGDDQARLTDKRRLG